MTADSGVARPLRNRNLSAAGLSLGTLAGQKLNFL